MQPKEWNLFFIQKLEWVTVSKLIILGYRNFQTLSPGSPGIIMLLYPEQMPTALGLINENVANGGLNGSYAKLTVNGVSLENVPVIIQPGQAAGTVGLSFGYGRQVGMKTEMQTGVNAYALYQGFNTHSKCNSGKGIRNA